MKKIASILLLAILLFNWVGFRVVTSFLQARSSARLIVKLDNHQYQDAELISVRIPSSLPYYFGSGEFERVNGEIELNNSHYNYVKRRVTADFIEYLCIPNRKKTAISKASDEFYKLVNDIGKNSPSKKDNHSGLVKVISSDYEQCLGEFAIAAFEAAGIIQQNYLQKPVYSVSIAPVELPPNA